METNWNMRATIFTSRTTARISEKQVVMNLKLCLLKKKMVSFFKKFRRHVRKHHTFSKGCLSQGMLDLNKWRKRKKLQTMSPGHDPDSPVFFRRPKNSTFITKSTAPNTFEDHWNFIWGGFFTGRFITWRLVKIRLSQYKNGSLHTSSQGSTANILLSVIPCWKVTSKFIEFQGCICEYRDSMIFNVKYKWRKLRTKYDFWWDF